MTNQEINDLLNDKMQVYKSGMIQLLRDCAGHDLWKDKSGKEALLLAADKLEELK